VKLEVGRNAVAPHVDPAGEAVYVPEGDAEGRRTAAVFVGS
jgi:hypothetical protein